MRGYGGGPHHTSLHPRHWDNAKTVTYVPGIGYFRTSEAMPYLRRLRDVQIRKCEAQLAEMAETEKLIDGLPSGSNRDAMAREAAEQRRQLEEIIADLRDSKADLGKGRRSPRRP